MTLDSHGRQERYCAPLERSNACAAASMGAESLSYDDAAERTGIARRLAGAPISWGVCELPGWGRMLPPDRVLGEMAALGLRATELGPVGYLPADPAALRARLDRHGLRLVGGFVPLILHEPTTRATRASVERVADLLAGAGADVFVGAVVADAEWSAPGPVSDGQWSRVCENLAEIQTLVASRGLTLALHPHVGTLVESAEDVERLMGESDVGWCLDTGHLLIGGWEPAEFVRRHADRIVHVHLKDVDGRIADRVRAGELSLVEGTRAGLFCPLGRGDADIDEVVGLLERARYDGWIVLEQDTAITGQEPPVERGPIVDARASVDFLTSRLRGERVPIR